MLRALLDTGQITLLTFLETWRAFENEEALAHLRAELRGLGGVLLIVSRTDGVFAFRADDDVERVVGPEEIGLATEIEKIARSYSVESLSGGALVLLDADGRARFKHEWSPATEGVIDLEMISAAVSSASKSLLLAPPQPLRVSRRDLVTSTLVTAFALAFTGGATNACKNPPSPTPTTTTMGVSVAAGGEVDVMLDVNGRPPRKVRVDVRTSLLDALRERMALTGTKKGCDHGQCGACTVLVDGRRVPSCMILAVQAEGSKIQTIEGLATGTSAETEALHPMQAAFIAEDALQCGYCTPGQIMSALGLVMEGHAKTDDEVREAMSGNICRCGAYTNIVSAIQIARKAIRP